MKWRVVMEVTDANGTVRAHEIGGGAPVEEYTPRTIGLTLAQGSSCSPDYSVVSLRRRPRTIVTAPAMPAVRGVAPNEGQEVPASFDAFRYGECFRAAVRAMPMRGDLPPDPELGGVDWQNRQRYSPTTIPALAIRYAGS